MSQTAISLGFPSVRPNAGVSRNRRGAGRIGSIEPAQVSVQKLRQGHGAATRPKRSEPVDRAAGVSSALRPAGAPRCRAGFKKHGGIQSAGPFPGLPADCGKHRRPRVIWLTGTWWVLVVHLLARWWHSPNNERHAEEADQETRDEACYEPEQARHGIPPVRRKTVGGQWAG